MTVSSFILTVFLCGRYLAIHVTVFFVFADGIFGSADVILCDELVEDTRRFHVTVFFVRTDGIF